MNVIKITFSIPPGDLTKLDTLADKQKRSRSSLIRWLVDEEYQRMDAKANVARMAALYREAAQQVDQVE